jgi:mRNA-degrading endonuclease toxin of MazEF toxin-antitoxin module
MGIFKPKDIIYADLPATKDKKTHEQAGNRPVVIIQDEDAYSSLPTVIIVPFTQTKSAIRFPSAFFVKPSVYNRLKGESVLLPFQIMAIDRRRLTIKIGELEDSHFNNLKENIKLLINLESVSEKD